MIYWEGDASRMAPPPAYPKAFGLAGPCTINMNPQGAATANVNSSPVVSNDTESTTVAVSDEGKSCIDAGHKLIQ